MKRTAFTLLFCSFFSLLRAQEFAVDSKGEPVFQLYSLEDARLQLTRRAPLSASYVFDTKAMKGTSGILVHLSVLNSGDFSMIERLRDALPGAGIKIGYQNTVSALSENTRAAHAWGVNAIFNVDNIKLYDPTKALAEKRYPVTYGGEGNYTHFFKSKNVNWRKALSLYASVTSTWNDRNLLFYQEIANVTINPDVVAMRDFDGRYGVLTTNFFKYRMALSFPMFYKKFNPTPYLVTIFGTQNSPSYHMGVFTNLLASSLSKSGNRLPSAFGLGFDWVYATEHLSGKVNVFVKAVVSLGRWKE